MSNELIDCPLCHGAGEVGFNKSRNNDPQCDDSATCPTCHGEGVIENDGRPIVTLEELAEEAAERAAEDRAEAMRDGWR